MRQHTYSLIFVQSCFYSEQRINSDVQTCQELKNTVELGHNVSVYLQHNVTCFDSVTVVSGQYVWVRGLPLEQEGRDKITVTVSSSFAFDSTASTSSTDDLAPDGSSSLFVVNSGGWLGLKSLEFHSGVGEGEEVQMNVASSTSGGNTDVASSDSAGREGGGVRAVYNAGELWVISCSFSALGSDSSNGVVSNGGAVSMEEKMSCANRILNDGLFSTPLCYPLPSAQKWFWGGTCVRFETRLIAFTPAPANAFVLQPHMCLYLVLRKIITS